MNNNDFELENMRQQMSTLKKKLDQQEIVNDHLIRHSMKNTAGNISRRYYFIMAVCLLMIPYSYWAFVMLNGFSIPFWIFTCITMLVSFGGTFYNSRNTKEEPVGLELLGACHLSTGLNQVATHQVGIVHVATIVIRSATANQHENTCCNPEGERETT